MASYNQPIIDFLDHIKRVIANAHQNSELSIILAEFGYTDTELQYGTSLLIAARSYYTDFSMANGRLSQATTLQQTWNKADCLYNVHRRLAQVALRQTPEMYELLGLINPKRRSLSDWLLQAKLFYTNALLSTDIQTGLARVNLTREKLLKGQARVRYVGELENAYAGNSPTTLERDNAVDTVGEWYFDFVEVAKVALETKPHLLKTLHEDLHDETHP